MSTAENKSTAVPVLGTGSKKFLGTGTFFKKYRYRYGTWHGALQNILYNL